MAKTSSYMQAYRARKKAEKAAAGASSTLLDDAISSYTNGSYGAIISAASDIMGIDDWQSGTPYDDEQMNMAKAMLGAMSYSDEEVTRTEWRNGDNMPDGADVVFPMKSTSATKGFEYSIASGDIDGMTYWWEANVEEGNTLVAYHISGSKKQLDVSKKSEFVSQNERIISGKFKVTGTREEVFDTGITNYKTPTRITRKEALQRKAEESGTSVEYFTSKKGVRMARVGGIAYRVDSLDQLTDGGGFENYKVKIRHVYLKSSR